MVILVIDVGGTHVKVSTPDRATPIRIPSGPRMTAAQMVKAVKEATASWTYDGVSIGFPGPVAGDRPAEEPKNLGGGWKRFNFSQAFGKPVRIVNDAAMQALGAYRGGRMLFLGLGTGLGSALVVDGVLAPLELAHLPYRKNRTYEDYVGKRGQDRMGHKRWSRHVTKVVALLKHGLQVHDVVLGGGEAKALDRLPDGVRRVRNDMAIVGGARLWMEPRHRSS
jgi:polyphosphate glucokinase